MVLANVFIPPALRPAAINLVTLDFPLVPLTCILIGIFEIAFLRIQDSINPKQIKRKRINRRAKVDTGNTLPYDSKIKFIIKITSKILID